MGQRVIWIQGNRPLKSADSLVVLATENQDPALRKEYKRIGRIDFDSGIGRGNAPLQILLFIG